MTRPFSKLVTLVRWLWRPALTLCLLVLPAGCIEWQQSVASERPTIANYISAVTTLDASIGASLATGTPQTGGGVPIVTAPIPALILLGGTIQLTASSATPFTKIAVVIPDLDDFWELTLPAATTSAQILMVFGQNIPVPVFQMRMAGALSGGYGALKDYPVSIISVGTGDVQVNITRDSRADVDLHVVDPLGEELYWAHKTAASGGTLDLDSKRRKHILGQWPGRAARRLPGPRGLLVELRRRENELCRDRQWAGKGAAGVYRILHRSR